MGAAAPDHVIGVEPVRRRPLTAEKVAINAVMAGCLAPHFPVVAAAVEAMCDEAFLLRKSNMSAPAPADVMRQATVCEAVIAAIGD